MRILLPLLFTLLLTAPAFGKSPDGCGAGSCVDCHTLTEKEASALLKPAGIDKIKEVDFAEMPGVWKVEVEKDRKTFPLYIDFSKSYVVVGNIVRLKDNKVIGSRSQAPKPQRIDVSRIPLEDAVLLGDPMASQKIVVFTDPLCPFCKKLHDELKEVVRRDPNVAFLIKMFPLDMHGPQAYDLSRAVVCSGSSEVLDQTFLLAELQQKAKKQPVIADAGRLSKDIEELEKQIMTKVCETPAVAAGKEQARELGIRSTPTLIFPDGRVVPGAKDADAILKLVARKAEK